jgi:hypothetical protein
MAPLGSDKSATMVNKITDTYDIDPKNIIRLAFEKLSAGWGSDDLSISLLYQEEPKRGGRKQISNSVKWRLNNITCHASP